MRKKNLLLAGNFFAFWLLCSTIVYAQLPAFPGAEGAGMYSTGGRGTPSSFTTVFEVTNLSDDGQPGSLRYALTAAATYRTVVFRVSGTIHLNSGLTIKANTTIAGQTAPGDGICVADHQVSLGGDNIIVRYMRFRVGDRYQKLVDTNGNPVNGSGGADALSGTGPSNIIIDHVTASWSNDEALTIYRGDNLTIQWSMMSEPLNYSYHWETGDTDYEQHGYGGIWGAKRGTMHHNLFAHCRNRNPRFAGISTYTPNTVGVENVDFRNNVIYNWGINTVYGGDGGNYNVVNNYYKYGPNTGSGVKYRICNPGNTPYGKWYVNGNHVDGSSTNTADNWLGVAPAGGSADKPMVKADSPLELGYPVGSQSAIDAYEAVLQGAGCSLPNRDTLDQRIVNDVRNRTGKIIDVQGGYPHGTAYEQTVNAWPALNSTTAPPDTDHDGMPDTWETAKGLNPNNASDRNGIASNGYTNLENYLNSLSNLTATTNPVVYANPSFSVFEQMAGAPSAVQTFSVSGSNLTEGISITVPANFEISNGGTTWGNSLTLPASSGTVAATTISVRLNASIVGNYSGSLVLSSAGANTVKTALSGTTSPATYVPSNQKQILGAFPVMEGGFENQAAGSVSTTAPASGTNLVQTVWTTSGSANIVNNGTARTGSNYFTYTSTSTSTKNVFSPTVNPPLKNNTKYIVQFYYRAPAPSTGNQVSGYLATADNTAFVQAYSTAAWTTTGGTWAKYTNSYSVNLASATMSFGGFRFNGGGSAIAKPFDVDDFVIYPADNQASPTPDIIAPAAATAPSATADSASINVNWTAPETGIDGGGYIVVRSTSATAPVPNTNGIYSYGSSMGTGNPIIYVGTATSFSDNGTVAAISPGTTYYYYIFTVDKAFNYSPAISASGAVAAASPTLSVSASFNPFNQNEGTPSDSQVFSVQGNNLTSNVNITAANGFELSDNNTDWSTAVSLAPASTKVNATAYVRLNAAVAGTYSTSITVASTGATATNLPVSGATTTVMSPPAGYDVVVAADGSGDYINIQAAIDAAPGGRTVPYRIFIKKGRYWGKLVIPSNKPFLQLIGEDVANTKIIYGDGGGGTVVVLIQANDVMLVNLTLENSQGAISDGPQSLAVRSDGDRVVFKNCRFISGQDTVMVNGAGKRVYFKTCYIDGNVDFIYGSAITALDSCVIYGRDRLDNQAGGVITADNCPKGQPYGLVFRDCILPANRGITNYSLGRPWHNSSRETSTGTNAHNNSVFLNTIMTSSIFPTGWSVWDAGTNTSVITYAEYKSKKFDGSLVDVSKRLSWTKQLTDAQAAAYYVNSNLYGSWDPYAVWPELTGNTAKPIALSNFRGIRSNAASTIPFNICWPIANVTYELHRSTDSLNYLKIKEFTISNDTTVAYAFTDSLPPVGSRYFYKIVASKAGYASYTTDNVVTIDPSVPLNGDYRSRASGGWTNNTTAVSSITSGKVSSVTITSSLTGYTSVPAVTFGAAPSGGVTASGTAVVTDGVVTGVTISNPGSGYSTAPSVTFSTAGISANSVWEKYNASSKAWETVALGTGASGNVTIASGHTVSINALVGANNIIIENGAVLQADNQSRNLRIKGDINNAGVFGSTNATYNKLALELDGTNGVYSLNGTGTYSFGTVRTLTAVQKITLNINSNLTLTNGLQAWYGSNNNTFDYGTNDVTINIKPGVTVTAGFLHSSSTSDFIVKTVGKYTYNINGTLDMSNSTATSALIPHKTIAQPINLNVNGILKLGKQFSTNQSPVAGTVSLNIGDGGLVDASKTSTFAITPNYFVVSGKGKLKRPVGTTAVVFPIGTSLTTYNPVTLINTGTADNFSVGVKNTFDYAVVDSSKVVNKQWIINEDVSGGSNLTTKFGWTAADQASGFDLTQPTAVMQYTGSTWSNTPTAIAGNGTVADPYTVSTSGITTLSAFGVTNYTKATANIKLEEASFSYDGNLHPVSGFAYGTGGVEDKLSPALNIVYKDTNGNVLNGAPVNAGTYHVVASYGGNAYYNSSSDTAIVTINPKTLTITANGQTKECGTSLNLGTIAFNVEGLVTADTLSSVSLSSDGAAGNAGKGSYSIIAANAHGTGLSNYIINYVNGSLLVSDVTKPVPDMAQLPELTGECSVTVTAVPTATDGCAGTLTASTNDPLSYSNQGSYTITWTYDDGNGNITTQNQSVVVKDLSVPIITYRPEAPAQCYSASGNYAIPALLATDNCGTTNITYSISGATNRNGSGANASGSFNIGSSTIHWVVDDGHGNLATTETTVVINGPLALSIPDVYAINPEVDAKNTLYLGYGPSYLTINVLPSGGAAPYTYLWNNVQGSSSLSVNSAGVYTVEVVDALGCSSSASVTINEIDVRCGNNNDKVMICHNGKVICVASSAVQEHLNHGDKLGSCNSGISVIPASFELEEPASSYTVELYPNPVSDILNIKVSKLEAGARVRVFSLGGVEVLSQGLTKVSQAVSVSKLQPGMYVITIENGNQFTREKFIKE